MILLVIYHLDKSHLKKADVMAMREIVLDGMSEEEMDTLCSLIKEANTEMESLVIYDNFFSRLSDPG